MILLSNNLRVQFSRSLLLVLAGMLATISAVTFAPAAPYAQIQVSLEQLPQEHEYQQTLRAFMATLGEKDFEVERQEIKVVGTDDPAEQYRLWLLGLQPYNITAVALPAAPFTLKSIESRKGLVMPATADECQMLSWLMAWDYAGNPYRGSRPIMLRAFVIAATDMMILDYVHEHEPRGADRADFLGGNLIWLGRTYSLIKKDLPEPVRAAFEAGLKRHVLRINGWGPRGAMTDMDLFAPVGLRYIADASSDPEIKQIAENYSRRLFTEPRFFHPAGYFVDNGCFDTSYNGISLFYSTWAALLSDWTFTHEAVAKAFRLRAHLCFPNPDGTFSGPSAMATRCSSDPPHDQWQFPPKTYGSGMISDDALYYAPLPDDNALKGAPAAVIAAFNAKLAKPREFDPQPWKESHWGGAMNYAYDLYKKGDYEKRLKLARENSPLIKPLYLRGEKFIREFDKAFLIAQFDGFAAAIHTGPVNGLDDNWHRPYGFGGGQLSAFWTPSTGATILGRRRGVQGPVFDTFEEWRNWPIHAVTGDTKEGNIVSSSRIKQPDTEYKSSEKEGHVHVSGVMPMHLAASHELVATDMHYDRKFDVTAAGVSVTTSVKFPAKETLAELYETLPIFLTETDAQKIPTIQFEVGDTWREATAEAQTNVKAVRIERFTGAVLITFSKAANVKLSPEIWRDGFQTQARCRTLLIDLLKEPAQKEAEVSYAITAGVPKG